MAITVHSWGVTPSDVANVTGASATTEYIAMADSIVSVVANRTAAASGSMSARDITWIQHAVCWQARWIPTQPELHGRAQFDSLTQDGLSVQVRAQWAKYLAPMAARALRNLSSKGPRAEMITPIGVPAGYGNAFFLQDEGDWYGDDWEELPI